MIKFYWITELHSAMYKAQSGNHRDTIDLITHQCSLKKKKVNSPLHAKGCTYKQNQFACLRNMQLIEQVPVLRNALAVVNKFSGFLCAVSLPPLLLVQFCSLLSAPP